MSKSSHTSNPLASGDSVPETVPLFILIDGHSLAFRSYYAFAKSRKGPLQTSTQIPTSICFGFINSLLQVIESQQPQFMAVAFDRGEPTFRHQADPTYKANRQETPEDFLPDLENLQELLSALNLQIVTSPGYEADDVLATLAKKASEAGCQVKIVSGDRDLFQLVDKEKNISVLYLDKNTIKSYSNGSYTEFDPAAVEKKLGVKPDQVVDYKALCGDQSDNIPGVRGIGDKTAVKLLKEYGTLEEIYQNLDKIKGAVKKRLEAGKKDAEHAQYLVQLFLEAPVDVALEECKLQGFDTKIIKPLLEKLELKTFLQKINQLQQQFGGPVETLSQEISSDTSPSSSETTEPKQLSLFNTTEPKPKPSKKVVKRVSIPIPITPKIIDTSAKLTKLINLLTTYTNPAQPVAWDTETSSLKPRDADLVGIGCCWGSEFTEVAYIPTSHTDGNHLDKEQVLSALRPLLESADYPKALQNTKFDRLVLWHQGIRLAGVVFDTMLASYVLHPEKSHNLSKLCKRYLSEITGSIPLWLIYFFRWTVESDLYSLMRYAFSKMGCSGITSQSYKDLGLTKDETIADLDIKTVADYCGMDAYVTFRLVPKLQAELEKVAELHKLLLEVEQPLEPVLAEMENQGVRIDTAYLQELSQQLEKDLQAIEQQAYKDAGEEFNLDSPKQLSELLFEKLGLNRKKSRKTKTGYSTDHATLEKLQGDHPVIDRMLEYRTLSKLKSTYVGALPKLVRADTQRVHANFNQTITATGRLSSSNPNLQNIPIRTAFSRKIRKAFIPEDDWLLVSADYSQIELRILAHLSEEPVLIEAYRNSEDVHSVTAKLLFDKEVVTPEERRLGKIINFGVIYGMGAQRFAREARVSAGEGQEFIDKYRQRYAQVFAYLEGMKKEAIAKGFVTTILGRRRNFDFESESLRKLRGCNPENIDLAKLKLSKTDAQLLRAAANAPIQGSSADIIKIAMVKMHHILQDYQARLLLQVHDELVFEVPPDEWEELQPQIKSAMENAVDLRVPLVVDVHAGNNWMEAK
ncbi:MAG: DNA polymerase I [Xenococcaceae cyanobacterium]